MRSLFALIVLALTGGAAPAAGYVPVLPAGAEQYTPAKYTQSISVLDERDDIRPTPVNGLSDPRWHAPGGLAGLDGWRSEKFRYVPSQRRVRSWIGNIGVRNSFGYVQQNRGIQREYPTGTRFDELLINTKTDSVFEHRVREKWSDGWRSTVHFTDETARPTGYTGLKVSCSSCHAEAGTGKYNEGLVPGGDTVLSDPLEWTVWVSASPEGQPTPKTDPKIPSPMPPTVPPKTSGWGPQATPTGPPLMAVPCAPAPGARRVVAGTTLTTTVTTSTSCQSTTARRGLLGRFRSR